VKHFVFIDMREYIANTKILNIFTMVSEQFIIANISSIAPMEQQNHIVHSITFLVFITFRMAMNQRSRLVVGIEVFAEVLADTAVVAEAVLGIEAVDTAVSVLSLLVSKRSMKCRICRCILLSLMCSQLIRSVLNGSYRS
jgi:hypothetical protein